MLTFDVKTYAPVFTLLPAKRFPVTGELALPQHGAPKATACCQARRSLAARQRAAAASLPRLHPRRNAVLHAGRSARSRQARAAGTRAGLRRGPWHGSVRPCDTVQQARGVALRAAGTRSELRRAAGTSLVSTLCSRHQVSTSVQQAPGGHGVQQAPAMGLRRAIGTSRGLWRAAGTCQVPSQCISTKPVYRAAGTRYTACCSVQQAPANSLVPVL